MKKLILLLLLYTAFSPHLFAQTDYYVDPLGNDGNTGGIGDPWLTIQHAINTVASGDIIHVASGTYTEDLSIPALKTNLEIVGAGVGSSIIQGVAQVASASFPLADPNIEILGDGTIIHGFTIKNPAWVDNFYSSGMVIGAPNVEIYGNEFQVAGSDDTNDISQGIQSVFNVDISGLNIHNNTFTHGAVSVAGYEGIYINYNSGVGAVTINTNTFSGNILRAITTEASNTTISNNSITTNLAAGIPGGYQGININYALGSGAVSSVTVSGNTVTGTGGGSFQFAVNIGLGSDNNTLSSISVSNNNLYGNDTGIRVREDDDQVTITGNDLSSNTTGVNNADPTPTTLNAEANWWGDVTGPFNATTNASGLGSPVSNNVDYSPWYGAIPSFTPMTYYGDPNDANYISDAIGYAQNGDEIIIQAGTYNAFTVNSEVTLTAEPGAYVNNGSPAITVAANNVTIDGFTFSYGTADYAIQVNAGVTGTVIVNCNFDVTNAVDNQSASSVTAEYNYWGFNGDIDGPTIGSNPGGTGGVITETGGGAVDYDPWVGKNTTPTNGYVGTATSGLTVIWDWLNFFGPNFDFELDHGGLQGEDASVTVGTNSYAIPGTLLTNTTYNWYVRSTTDPLANWIGPFSFTTTVAAPVLVSPADLSEGLATSFTFTWNSVPGANEYQIQVDDDPLFGSPFIQTTTGGATTYNAVGFATGTTYYWRVRGSNNGGTTWDGWSAEWEFMTDFLSSVANPSQGDYAVGISVLPTFTWLAVAGATSYDLEVDTDPLFGSPLALTSSTTIAGLTYTITEFEQLNSGTLYYWRVKVNGGTSDGKYSAVWEFTTHIGTLTITTYYPYGTSASIAWLLLPYTSNVKYDLYYSDDNFATHISVTDLTNTYYTLTGLDPGTTYEVLVRAKNNAGTVIIAYSATVTFTTEGLPTPYLSYPIGGATTYSNPPYLYWYTGTLFSGQYQARYATNSSVDVNGMLDDVSATNLALTSNLFTTFPAALTAGGTYYWQVRCYDGTNYGGWSAVESFIVYSTTPSSPVVPYLSYPTGGATVYINPPTFYWYTGTYTTGLEFYVEWDDDSDLDTAPLGNSGWITDLYFTLPSNLTSGTDYWWRVKSRLAAPPNTESAWSIVETFEMSSSLAGGADQPYPSSPVGTSILTLTPTLTWTIFTSQTLEYQVRISPYSSTDLTGMLDHVTAVSSGWVSSTSIGVGSIPFTLVPGATYYWQVRSRLTATPTTMSSWSYVVYFQTAAGALSVVPLIGSPNYGQPINNTSAMLSWIIPTQSQSHLVYTVEYSKSEDFSDAVVVNGINEPFAQIEGLEQNTKYYWRVSSSTNNGSQSMYSGTGTFSTSSVTDVEEVEIPTELLLEQNYPNPFNPTTRITYSLPENSFVSLKIYDILGREVSTLVNSEVIAGTHSVEWNGTDNYGNKVASGTYIYRIITGNFSSTKKMILIK